MVAGNHDIEIVFIDGVLKQANINLNNLPDFLEKLNKLSKENNIEFFVSVSAEKKEIQNVPSDSPDYCIVN